MKKILYVNGCSHAAGMEISFPDSHRTPNDIKKSWGGQLASRYNLIHENEAIASQSNDSILSNTLNSISNLLLKYKPEEILVIIAWTSTTRHDFIYKNAHWRLHPRTMDCAHSKEFPTPIKLAWQSIINGSDSNFEMNDFSIKYFTLASFLKSYKIDYLFFNSFTSCFIPTENILHSLNNKKINSHIFEMMKTDLNYLGAFDIKHSYFQYLESKGFSAYSENRDGHYLEDAHTVWADHLENSLLNTDKLVKYTVA
jgi:hypothetical protein